MNNVSSFAVCVQQFTRCNRLLLLSAALLLLTACASHRDEHITVSPSPCLMTADTAGRADLSMTVSVPAKYFTRRSRLIVTPQLVPVDDDSTVIAELPPLVLDAPIFGQKMHRREKLEGYSDPLAAYAQRSDRSMATYDYRAAVQLPQDVSEARVVAVVTTDGCGQCTGFDRFDMATLTAAPAPVESLGLTWMAPVFKPREKVMQGQGTAHIQFVINKYDIVPELGNNRSELEDIVSKLQPIVSDTLATVKSISIYGMASADGPLSLNTPLSENRARSAKAWLIDRLQLPQSIAAIIKTGSRPEGWQPVLDAMTADGNPDSVKVKDILTRYAAQNDDVQERHIRRLACWPVIRERYLQKDRKVDYAYTWVIRSFTTDAELVAMYQSRPDAFSEEELLRVAQLHDDQPHFQQQVYRYVLGRFPRSRVAANNLAILLEREGKYEEARKLWQQFSKNQ